MRWRQLGSSGVNIVPFLVCILGLGTAQVKVVMKNQGLTKLPDALQFNVTILDLSENSISYFVFPSGYLFLQRFIVKWNKLSIFPDCRNLAGSLEELVLAYNEISSVDPNFLSGLPLLTFLHLGYNRLTYFPDSSVTDPVLASIKLYYNAFTDIPWMPNLGKSIKSIQIGNNPLRQLSLSNLQQLTVFTNIGMMNTSVSTFPNLCHLKRATPEGFVVNAEDLFNLACDGHLRWIKLMNESAPILNLNAAPCYQPIHLSGRQFTSISAKEMEFAGE